MGRSAAAVSALGQRERSLSKSDCLQLRTVGNCDVVPELAGDLPYLDRPGVLLSDGRYINADSMPIDQFEAGKDLTGRIPPVRQG